MRRHGRSRLLGHWLALRHVGVQMQRSQWQLRLRYACFWTAKTLRPFVEGSCVPIGSCSHFSLPLQRLEVLHTKLSHKGAVPRVHNTGVTAVQTVKGDRLHGVCSPLFVFVSPVTRRLQRVLTPRLTINNEERAKNKVLREACLVIACLFTADFTYILFVLQFVNKIVNKMNALPVSNLHRATATRV